MARINTVLGSVMVAVAMVALAGCGGSESAASSTSSSSGSAKSGGLPNCSAAPESAVNAAFGTSYGAPTADTSNPSVVVCSYPGKDASSPSGVIRFEEDASDLASVKKGFVDSGQPVTDLSGYGDEAFSSTIALSSYTSNSVLVRKGTNVVQIVSSGAIDKEAAYAVQLLSKF